MRTLLVGTFLLVFGTGFSAATVECTLASDSCKEWVTTAGRTERVMVYRSHPLTVRNDSLRTAIIVVHGGNRNANDQFDAIAAAAFLGRRLDSTLVIAPKFSSSQGTCKDVLQVSEANWGCEDRQPDSWRNGAGALNDRALTSFDVVDDLLRTLGRKDLFPNMQRIVVTGHSGGGQFTMRYAMASTVIDGLGVPVSFVVSNPDALAYVDSLRPTAAAYPASAAAPGFPVASPSESFVEYPDARTCTAFNDWPYGLQNRTGYASRVTVEVLTRQLASRNVLYLLGALDLSPAGLDQTCPAVAQGPTRLARSLAFVKYLNERFGASQQVKVVGGCGHNERCVFTSADGIKAMFAESK
jgi:pimeloyl-ACP methyl ester carboxylesterase